MMILNVHLKNQRKNFQNVYEHSIPKNLNAGAPSGKRINVTMRKFKGEKKKSFSS
jgi:hypothetical protein